jgi:hypothetical protein
MSPCKRVNIALLEGSRDAATRSMSRFTRVRCDMPRRACRSGSVRGATCQTLHVARRARDGRHSRANVSPRIGVQGDMHRRQCRSGRSPRATCGAESVAPPNCLERHERPGIGRTHVSWSDILDRICRPTRPESAAWTRMHVAAQGMVTRHDAVTRSQATCRKSPTTSNSFGSSRRCHRGCRRTRESRTDATPAPRRLTPTFSRDRAT